MNYTIIIVLKNSNLKQFIKIFENNDIIDELNDKLFKYLSDFFKKINEINKS